MCCESDPKSKRIFLKALGKRKTFKAWKVLRKEGTSLLRRFQYKGGLNEDPRATTGYRIDTCRGFHFFLQEPRSAGGTACRVVEIRVHRDDLLVIERHSSSFRSRSYPQQGVARKITIPHKEWARKITGESPRRTKR